MSHQEKTTVGVVQMCSTADVDANMDSVRRLVGEAAGRGAQMILVPECFSYLGPEKGKAALAESLTDGGPILDRCAAIARELGVDVVYGGFWEKSEAPGKVHNACVYMRADGSITSVYRKIHLFDVDLSPETRFAESDTIRAGEQVDVEPGALSRAEDDLPRLEQLQEERPSRGGALAQLHVVEAESAGGNAETGPDWAVMPAISSFRLV